jgi:cellulose synthase/poly-beta-1,6-N-acetylglucosamine synthase-like glycosyltransferase
MIHSKYPELQPDADRRGQLMSSLPLASVIMPVRNGEAFIDEALRSLLAQTYPNLEIIVVDDGSTDRTYALAEAHAPRVRCIRHASGSGSASAPRNTGLRHCAGEYICFLDADDILLPDRIENRVKFLSSHPEAGLVFGDYRNFWTSGQAEQSHFQTCSRLQMILGGRQSIVLTSEEATAILAQENFGISGTFMIRRAVLEGEPGFEPTLRACEDFHFYYRVARRWPVGIINEIGMMRRLHNHNMTADPSLMVTESIRSRALLRDSEKDSRNRGYLNRYLAESHASLARIHAERGNYLKAIAEDARALVCHVSARRLRTFCRGIARTIAIATGAHRPNMGSR